MDKIEELEEKALELEDKALKLAQEIAKLKKGQNAGGWKPQDHEMYWYMSFDGEPDNLYFDSSHSYDIWRVKNIPVFQTREECQKYCDYRKALIEKSYKFSREEWNNGVFKYSIEYNYEYCKWGVSCNQFSNYIGKIHFNTRGDAQFIIDNYSEEMLKWGLI
jgi:hypothetical protein